MIVKIGDYKFKIRKCKDDDYSFVYNLMKRNMYDLIVKHWGGWKPEAFREAFDKNNVGIVEYTGKRVAYYDLEFKNKYSYVHNIQVSTLMRGKGLGTFLIGFMEKDSIKHRLKKIRLRVFKDNKIAMKLYLKLGYNQIKDDDSSIILEKKL